MVVTLIAAYGMLYVIVEGSIDLSVGGIVALSAIAVAKTVGVLGGFAVIPAVLIGILCGATLSLRFLHLSQQWQP